MSGIRERVDKALQVNPKIITTIDDLDGKAGYSYKEFLDLGITKSDLKKLARNGLAISAYHDTGRGYQKKWYILNPFARKDTPNE